MKIKKQFNEFKLSGVFEVYSPKHIPFQDKRFFVAEKGSESQ